MFESFVDEYVAIKQAGLVRNVLGGAAIGAVGAGATGNEKHMLPAMVTGAALGAGVRRGRYSFRTPAMLAAVGGAGYVGNKIVGNQMAYDTATAQRYANTIMNQPGVTPGRWQ